MAARFRTIAHTIGAASQSLSAILANPHDDFVSNIVLRAKWDNVGRVFWTDNGVAYGGYIEPREAVSMDLAGKYVSSKDLYIAGTQGDVVYITVVG